MPENIFYQPRRSRKLPFTPAGKSIPRKDAQTPGLIQGRPAGSMLEWNVSIALAIMEYRYFYQYLVGGRGILGTQTVDFLVFTPGLPTPVQVHGRYWHTGIHADELDDIRLVRMMGGMVRRPVIVWEENCTTVEKSLAYLRQNLV